MRFFRTRFFEILLNSSLLFPQMLLIFIDKTPWYIDPTIYAIGSMHLYYAFSQSFWSWWQALWSLSPQTHACMPMLLWLGQFFVPLGLVVKNIKLMLLVQILLIGIISLNLMYVSLKIYFKDKKIAWCGVLFYASVPIFVGMSRQFYVEPLQLLATTWAVYIVVMSKAWDFWRLFFQTIFLLTFTLMVKISAPVYVSIIAVYLLIMLCRSWQRRIAPKVNLFNLLKIVGLLLCVLVTAVWSFRNIGPVFDYTFKSSAAFGDSSLGLLGRLSYWLVVFQQAFFEKAVFLLVSSMVILVALGFCLWCQSKRYDMAIVRVFSLQIIFVVVVLVVIINQDTKYLYALIPYIVFVFCWAVSIVNIAVVNWLVLLVFIMQFALVQLRFFNILPWTASWDWHALPLNKYAQSHAIQDQLKRIIEAQKIKSVCFCGSAERLHGIGLRYEFYLESKGAYSGPIFLNIADIQIKHNLVSAEAIYLKAMEYAPELIFVGKNPYAYMGDYLEKNEDYTSYSLKKDIRFFIKNR